MSIMTTSITRSITITFSLITRIVRCTAPPSLVVTPTALLARCRLYKRESWPSGCLCLDRLHTAVVLGVEERSEYLAVIVPTHKISITVTILLTVSLSLHTRLARAATSSGIEVATTTPWATLALYLFSTGGLGLHTTVILGVEERSECLAVIVPTDKISLAITISFTVSFPLHTRTGY